MNSPIFQIDQSLTDQAHQLSPYSQGINLRIGSDQQGNRLFHLPFAKQNIGNIFLVRLHGGLLGGFLQSCIYHYLSEHTEHTDPPFMINFAIDYLRAGNALDSYAQCQILHSGRRISQVTVTMWQDNLDKPIAIARAHLRMPNDD